MKNNKHGKILIITLIMLTQSVLIGAGIFAIGLRNVDTGNNRLVKIDALVGGKYMPDPSKVPNTEEQKEQPEKEDVSDKHEESENKQETKPKKTTSITVRVSGTNIYINGSIVVGAPFETQFSNVYSEEQDVVLQDDYADYQVYKKVLDYLIEKGIDPKERKL